jgi:hypothetical protein
MAEVILYSQKEHLKCEELKGALHAGGILYREINIMDPDTINHLKEHGCHSLEPPVIGVFSGESDRNFLTNDDLFWDGTLVREAVLDLANRSPRPAS